MSIAFIICGIAFCIAVIAIIAGLVALISPTKIKESASRMSTFSFRVGSGGFNLLFALALIYFSLQEKFISILMYVAILVAIIVAVAGVGSLIFPQRYMKQLQLLRDFQLRIFACSDLLGGSLLVYFIFNVLGEK